MKIQEVLSALKDWAPLSYAEDFDNVGLLVGEAANELTNVLIAHDTLEETIDEAVQKDCNLIISFHPIIFKGLKKLTGSNYVERTVAKAIKKEVAIYALHTALDNQINGVSGLMAKKLALQDVKVLVQKPNTLLKLRTFVPTNDAGNLRQALFKAGAGHIGNYEHCSYNVKGIGTFLPNEQANPAIGERGKLQEEPETAITVYFEKHKQSAVMRTLFAQHPYEEVAYEVIPMQNTNQNLGLGVYGDLRVALSEKEFMKLLKDTFNLDNIRHSQLLDKPIQKVAVLGGSGSFAIGHAKAIGADAYVSADFKYHDFFQAEKSLLLTDIGHYESEAYTKNLIADFLTKKFTNFAPLLPEGKVHLSEVKTNPVYNF